VTSPIGRAVTYHGPRTDRHGTYRVVGFCRCDRCDEAFEHRQDRAAGAGWGPQRRDTYVLQSGSTRLRCVSAPTITLLAAAPKGVRTDG
jgi:hypothetical protein